MTETTKQKALRNTVFGEVLLDLFESRNLISSGPGIIEFADASGCDGEAVVRRMVSADYDPGFIGGLARDLDLSPAEREELFTAFTIEERTSDSTFEGEAMTEQIERKHPEMQNTVFGQVLTEILEVRDLLVTPFKVGKLAEDNGVDGWAVINRMASTDHGTGYLDGLATALNMSEEEMLELACANAFEERSGYWSA